MCPPSYGVFVKTGSGQAHGSLKRFVVFRFVSSRFVSFRFAQSTCLLPCKDEDYQMCYTNDECSTSICHMCAVALKDAELTCESHLNEPGDDADTCPLTADAIALIHDNCGHLFFSSTDTYEDVDLNGTWQRPQQQQPPP